MIDGGKQWGGVSKVNARLAHHARTGLAGDLDCLTFLRMKRCLEHSIMIGRLTRSLMNGSRRRSCQWIRRRPLAPEDVLQTGALTSSKDKPHQRLSSPRTTFARIFGRARESYSNYASIKVDGRAVGRKSGGEKGLALLELDL